MPDEVHEPAHPAPSAPDTTDADVGMSAGGWRVRTGGALTALAGLLAAVTGFQLFISVTWVEDLLNAVPLVFMALGALMIVVGAILYRARGWAAMTATMLSTVSFLATGAWNVFAIMNGIFSCIAGVAPLLAFGATLMAALSIPEAREATKARARLARSGISLGL